MIIELTREGCPKSCDYTMSCNKAGIFKKGFTFNANMYNVKPNEAHWCGLLGGANKSPSDICDNPGYAIKLDSGTLYWIPKFMTEQVPEIPKEELEKNATLEVLRTL